MKYMQCVKLSLYKSVMCAIFGMNREKFHVSSGMYFYRKYDEGDMDNVYTSLPG